MFTEEQIVVIQKLYSRKSLTDEEKELVPAIQDRLNAESKSDIPERFAAVTGWSNPPKDYPI